MTISDIAKTERVHMEAMTQPHLFLQTHPEVMDQWVKKKAALFVENHC